MKRLLMLVVAVVGLAAGAVPSAALAMPSEPDVVPDELIVQYQDGASAQQQAAARERVHAVPKSEIGAAAEQHGRLEVAQLPSGSDVWAAAKELERDPNVLYAEPNILYHAGPVITAKQPGGSGTTTAPLTCSACNDTIFTNDWMWGTFNTSGVYDALGGYHANQYGSQADEAWANGTTGSRSIAVGVIDEGIDLNHPDLAPNIWTNPNDTADGADNDGNGYTDDLHGWNFVDNNNQIYTPGADDHGTHVAGTIGAQGGNGQFVAGINWNVQLIDAKFLDASGSGTLENALRALNYLVDLKVNHGVNLVAVNNSWGCSGSGCYSKSMQDAINRAARANIMFIAAAGNNGTNNDATPEYPANYSSLTNGATVGAASYDNVISVAALDEYGKRPSWSDYGKHTVDIAAPGAGILSTVPGTNGDYSNAVANYSGTSMATPHVTGAVALYVSTHPGATGAQIRNALLSSATATSSMNRVTVTNGRLNIAAMLTK